MATKKDALAAMKALKGDLVEASDDTGWTVYLKAPVGRVWSDFRGHQKSILEYITGDKSQFWDLVISDIQDLGLAVPCNEHSCEHWNHEEKLCEYWDEQGLWQSSQPHE